MKDEAEVIEKVRELRTAMDQIQAKASKELEKKRPEMDIYLLRFLSQECSVYQFALSNLEWVLGENE